MRCGFNLAGLLFGMAGIFWLLIGIPSLGFTHLGIAAIYFFIANGFKEHLQ